MADEISAGPFLNEDANHFAYTRTANELTFEGVDALVDGYARDNQVTDLVFNPNASRSAIPSRVKQVFWEGYDPGAGDDQPYFAHTHACREIMHRTNRAWLLLQERGIDLYARWIERTRALGARA